MVAPPSIYKAGTLEGLDRDQDIKVISSVNFPSMLEAALAHPRKRKMFDLTKSPERNSMQSLMNVWTEGSYSHVHKHEDYAEVRTYLLS